MLLAPLQVGCPICGPSTFTILFDDQADTLPSTDNLSSGTFRPYESLSAFHGLDALGDWTLTIGDIDASGATRYRSFTLIVSTIPEPSTLFLLALPMGFLFWRFRYSRVK